MKSLGPIRIFLSMAIVMLALFSCTDERYSDDTYTKSETAKVAMQRLKKHFNPDTSLKTTNNKTKNILFDYGFDFRYPVALTLNTGQTVIFNDFNELVNVLVSTTDLLYIDGINFPFEVEVFDRNTRTINISTITNESEFETMYRSNDDNDDDDDGDDDDDDDDDDDCNNCMCNDNYNPVCVEITCNYDDDDDDDDDDSTTYIFEFQNACYAECYGFVKGDYVNCDGSSDECFVHNFPVSITDNQGNTIEINSQNEWNNVMYSTNGNFDYVYPISITLTADQSVQTITNLAGLNTVLDTCNGTNNCNCSTTQDPVCVLDTNGNVIEYLNPCEAECDGYTAMDIFTCAPKK